ncbi:MAG: LysM peptidoglycan-binding domain-containing protein [Mailhella sp.]|nr:LysM peptidoglycan-binding domain-containing protein [Mailhella sp.]
MQTAASTIPPAHTVKAGESLTGIARQYGLPLSEIYAANGGAAKLKNIQPGQKIKLTSPADQQPPVPGAATKAAANAPGKPAAQAAGNSARKDLSKAQAQQRTGEKIHVVKPGENLWSIARAYQMTPSALMKMNDLTPDTKVKIGDKIKVSAGSKQK